MLRPVSSGQWPALSLSAEPDLVLAEAKLAVTVPDTLCVWMVWESNGGRRISRWRWTDQR